MDTDNHTSIVNNPVIIVITVRLSSYFDVLCHVQGIEDIVIANDKRLGYE